MSIITESRQVFRIPDKVQIRAFSGDGCPAPPVRILFLMRASVFSFPKFPENKDFMKYYNIIIVMR